MIKLLREAAHDYPWFLKSIMGVLALAFVITMGWWGFGQESGNVVAFRGDQAVPLDEFRRAYENTYRFYKDKGQLKRSSSESSTSRGSPQALLLHTMANGAAKAPLRLMIRRSHSMRVPACNCRAGSNRGISRYPPSRSIRGCQSRARAATAG